MKTAVIVILAWICLTAPAAKAASSTPSGAQAATLAHWLARNPNYRVATEADCACSDDIHDMRTSGPWGDPIRDYEPYVLVGDFRKNGQLDLAVVVTLVRLREPGNGVLLIFDGPFRASAKQPAFVGRVGSLAHTGLFLAKESGYPIFGAFFSEGCLFRPRHQTYVKDCGSF